MRFLFKGKALNNYRDNTLKEVGLIPGDTILILNHLKHNHI